MGRVMKLERTFDRKLPTAILAMDLIPGGPLLTACFDGVYRVETTEGKHERFGEHASYASGVRTIDPETCVTAGYDGQLIWRKVQTGEVLRTIAAHRFWSWDLDLSPDRRFVASVTGQYLAGSYRYDPAPESEPSLKIFRTEDGSLVHALEHVPSVQAVAFSPDSQHVAAANLMGRIKVWHVESGELKADWTTPDFTSWGRIKSHCYIGGIHALTFSPDGQRLLAAGMGPMDDPMAGNGKQLWQEFAWSQPGSPKTRQIKDDQAGEGLMETITYSQDGKLFVMAGRLRGGNWNAAVFDDATGERLAAMASGFRITDARFDPSNGELWVAGTQGQPSEKKQDGSFPKFGRLERYQLVNDAAAT